MISRSEIGIFNEKHFRAHFLACIMLLPGRHPLLLVWGDERRRRPSTPDRSVQYHTTYQAVGFIWEYWVKCSGNLAFVLHNRCLEVLGLKIKMKLFEGDITVNSLTWYSKGGRHKAKHSALSLNADPMHFIPLTIVN